MTYNRTYKSDLNSHQVKKRSKTIVCSTFNNPGLTIRYQSWQCFKRYPATSKLSILKQKLTRLNFFVLPHRWLKG